MNSFWEIKGTSRRSVKISVGKGVSGVMPKVFNVGTLELELLAR